MPNIQEVDAGSGQLTVPERGSDAYAQMGRRVGSFYHSIGEDIGGTVKTLGDQYVEHQTNQEVNNLYAATTTAEQNLQRAWQTYSTDPANKGRPDLAASFMADHVKPVLEELASHAQTDTGKRLAAEEVARVSQNVFHSTIADQSDLDSAQWHNNSLQTMSNIAAGALSDPSTTDQRIGDWMRVAENTIPSTVTAGQRATLLTQFQNEGAQRIALAGYLGGIEAGKAQLAAGGATSPALDAVRRDITAQRNFQYLSPAQQAELSERVDQAEARGKEMYHQGQVVTREALKTEGAANYAQIDTAITNAITSGQPVTPAMRQAIDDYSTRYGATNPGEVHSLNEAWSHATTLEQEHRVQRTDPATWADVQTRVALPPTDPHALTDSQLADMWSAGKLSTDDYKLARELRSKTATDPAMKVALEQFHTWQGHMISGLPMGSGRGVAAGIFQHDSTATFMQWVASGETPAAALDIMTNPQNNKNFMQSFDAYRRAARQTDAAAYLRQARTGSRDYNAPVEGSPAHPVWPTSQGAGPPGAAGTSATFDDRTANARTLHLPGPAPGSTPLSDAQVHDLMSH